MSWFPYVGGALATRRSNYEFERAKLPENRIRSLPGWYDRRMQDACAFVLAGGKSSRMGKDKAFLKFQGQTLLERTLATARSAVSEVVIVGSHQKFGSFAETIEDKFPECGPLGGIHAALRSSKYALNLVLAVDMPFLQADWLRYLLDQARNSSAVVTLARTADGWQPLCAVYRKEFLPVAESALHAGDYRITRLFSNTPVCTIDESAIQSLGFTPEIFRNLNTPEEFESANLVKES